MKKSLIYILSLAALFLMHSCGLEEINAPEPGTSKAGTIEFVARPTYYDEYNVATKVSSDQINNLENTIYTAFFMLFDNDGNRVVFQDLTSAATSGGSVSCSVVSDKGLSSATACFLANVPTSYAKSLTTVADLKGDEPLELVYASITSECVGIPLLTDASKSLDNVYSIPMAGVYQGDLSALGDFEKSIQIPLERLFAKIIVKLNLNIPDENETDTNVPQFTLSNFVVNNMPNKVTIMAPENDPPATKWAASDNEADYLVTDNWMSNFNLDNGTDDSETVTTGQGAKSLFFYVPEHMVPRDRENETKDEGQKPLLVDADKKPIYVSLKGNLNIPGSSPMVADYDIYMGENEYDDFNIKRNRLYTNNIVINGSEPDHRVEFIHGDVSVLFKRATYLDSHFEVRPLRVKWTGEGTASGTITVKVMDAYDDEADAPDWVSLERPTASERTSDLYCGSIGKRKYFTTDLVKEINKTEEYSISEDEEGDYPTWVYVDEYIMPDDATEFTDDVRQARIRVIFTPDDAIRDVLTVDYVITQRSVYPVEATYQDVKNTLGIVEGKYTYGIEYFEEYLYDYDRVDVEDLADGEYASTQNGMAWGLDGVQLSNKYISSNISEDDVHLNNTTFESIMNTIGGKGIVASIMNSTLQDESLPYYDFYLSADDPGTGIQTFDYSGLSFNQNILQVLKNIDSGNNDVNLSTNLSETPKSVIEYCYNKNKRNDDGSISTIHWYAPAIDEIEDIAISAYNIFDVFQDEYYWSCQPAYDRNILNIPSGQYKIIYMYSYWLFGTRYGSEDISVYGTGEYRTDDLDRARATKVDDNGNTVTSGVNGDYYEEMTITGSYTECTYDSTKTGSDIDVDSTINENGSFIYDSGNILRTGTKNRVRCIYSKEGIAL